jgi:hypothetical protein
VPLVIGGAYTADGRRANAPADARRIAAALTRAGFGRVEIKTDLGIAISARHCAAFKPNPMTPR